MICIKKYKFFILIFASLLILPEFVLAGTGTVNVGLIVPGCNNNGICEPVIGENSISCPLDCPIAPTSTPAVTQPSSGVSGGHAGSNFGQFFIKSLSISTAEQSAEIDWSTNLASVATVSWGLTTDHEIGQVSSVNLDLLHQSQIPNLQPATHYYFEVTGQDLLGRSASYAGDFYTLSLPNLISVPNVRDLRIASQNNSLALTWRNPDAPEFSGVVVVRSPYRYPIDASDGKIIYQGPENSVTDTDVVADQTYYYSVFVYDPQNNYSSGVIGKSRLSTAGTSTVAATSTPATTATTPAEIIELKLSDVDFIQGGRSIVNLNGLVPVTSDQNLTVSISRSKLPAEIDFGTLTVTDPASASTTYLFSLNKARDAYEAQVNVYGVESGVYPFTITLDLSGNKRAVLSAEFTLIKAYKPASSGTALWNISYGIILVALLAIFTIFLLFFIIFRRRKSKK